MEIEISRLKRMPTFGRFQRPNAVRRFMNPVKQELLKRPYNDIKALDLKLIKTLEFVFTYENDAAFHKFVEALKRQIPDEKFLPQWRNFLIRCGRFDDVIEVSRKLREISPNDPEHAANYIISLLIAGQPAQAMALIYDAPQLLFSRRDVALKVARIVIQAGDFEWLQKVAPQVLASIPALKQTAIPAVGKVGSVKTYCISLGRDWRRYKTTSHFLKASNINLEKVEAVLGSALPQQVIDQVLDQGFARGELSLAEIGINFSHMKVWEKIAQNCAADEYALVTEDDSRFVYGGGRGILRAVQEAQNAKTGLMFVNVRSSVEASKPRHINKARAVPLPEFMDKIQKNTVRRDPGWGTDGYFLNGATAKNLLEHWLKPGLITSLDWQLYLLAMTDLETVPVMRPYKAAVEHLKKYRAAHPDSYVLPASVYTLPLVTANDYGYSSIHTG